MNFIKPARTWHEQVELLRSRGLHIPDREKARHYLSHINYYRLTGYWLPFEADHSRKPAGLVSSFNPDQTRHVYNTLVMLAAMMDVACPGHLWKTRLQQVVKQHRINVLLMGFPKDWQQRPVWTELQEDGQ